MRVGADIAGLRRYVGPGLAAVGGAELEVASEGATRGVEGVAGEEDRALLVHAHGRLARLPAYVGRLEDDGRTAVVGPPVLRLVQGLVRLERGGDERRLRRALTQRDVGGVRSLRRGHHRGHAGACGTDQAESHQEGGVGTTHSVSLGPAATSVPTTPSAGLIPARDVQVVNDLGIPSSPVCGTTNRWNPRIDRTERGGRSE